MATEWVCPVRFLRKQGELIRFRAPGNQRETKVALGEPGAGKTLGAAAAFLEYCYATGDDAKAWDVKTRSWLTYSRREHPISGLVGATISEVRDGPLEQIYRVINPRMIRKDRPREPWNYIELINGHRIRLYSLKGSLKGQTWCAALCDEIEDPMYAKTVPGDVTAWQNIVNRVRDKRATRLGVVASGYAVSRTHVEDWFRHRTDPTMKVVVMNQRDNMRNLGGNISELRRMAAASDFDLDDDGWKRRYNVLWPRFGAGNIHHGVLAELEKKPVSIGVDLRSHGAVVFTVDIEVEVIGGKFEPGLLVVDEWMPNKLNAELIARGICDKLNLQRWRFEKPRSVIALDPTISDDEVQHFRKLIPGGKIVQARGEDALRKTGIRCVDIAIQDGNGDEHLMIHESLIGRGERGVYASITGYNGEGRDDPLEHAADALRYITMAKLPIRKPAKGGVDLSTGYTGRSAIRDMG